MKLDLSIDTAAAIRALTGYISSVVARDGRDGAMLGLSGGLDSAVLAALMVRALGPERTRAAYLHDADSAPEQAGYARMMADQLGLRLEVTDITETMARRRVYAPLFIKALRLSPLVAKLSVASYRTLCGETPFKSTLRVGAGETLHPWHKRAMFGFSMFHVDRGFTERHVFRRRMLEQQAEAGNLALIGAANRSEAEVGWFVKDGIDDLPCQPMTGLLKTQVRQLAQALNLPAPVRGQLPSPDMAKGVTDEFGIGHDYVLVDQVIDGLDRGMTDDQIVAMGIPAAELADIRDLMALSAWKRASPHEAPPVSGCYGSDLRLSDRGAA